MSFTDSKNWWDYTIQQGKFRIYIIISIVNFNNLIIVQLLILTLLNFFVNEYALLS